MSIILIFLILSAICFCANALNAKVSVNLDAAGKCFLVIAAIAHYWG